MVYNNFPWPESATAKQRAAVAAKAQAVLDARAQFMDVGAPVSDPARTKKCVQRAGSEIGAPTQSATLADLYDPLAMPPALARAHAELDRAVDLCYRPEKFESDRQRVEYLFALYEKLTAPLLPAAKAKKGRHKL